MSLLCGHPLSPRHDHAVAVSIALVGMVTPPWIIGSAFLKLVSIFCPPCPSHQSAEVGSYTQDTLSERGFKVVGLSESTAAPQGAFGTTTILGGYLTAGKAEDAPCPARSHAQETCSMYLSGART